MLEAVAALEPVQVLSVAIKALTYLSVLLAAGGALNLAFLPGLDAQGCRRLARLTAGAAGAGLILTLARLPVRAAVLWGGLDGALDPAMLDLVTTSPLGTAAYWRVPALLAIILVLVDRPWARGLAVAGALGVAASFALRGHAVGDPRLLLGGLFALHGLAAAFWIGAFFPLHDLAVRRAAGAATAARAFGRVALFGVAVLVTAGAVLTGLLGGLSLDLVREPWGQVLIVKLVLVTGLLGLAALNKLVFAPRLDASGEGDGLARSIRWEGALAFAILLLTALLTTATSPHGAEEMAWQLGEEARTA